MIETATLSTDLIGYLTFDAHTSQATLVVCGRRGRPVRTVALEPIGALARILVRLCVRIGYLGRSCRAVARDVADSRGFTVWSRDGRFVIADEAGAAWLRSIDERSAAIRSTPALLPNPEVITVVRRYGFGDASRN